MLWSGRPRFGQSLWHLVWMRVCASRPGPDSGFWNSSHLQGSA